MASDALCQLLDASEQQPADVELRLQLLQNCWSLLGTPAFAVNEASKDTDMQEEAATAGPCDGATGEGTNSMAQHAGSQDTGADLNPPRELLWQALVQQQYLLALDLLMSPQPQHHAAADELVAQLCQGWRLADAVWAECGQEPKFAATLSETLPAPHSLPTDSCTCVGGATAPASTSMGQQVPSAAPINVHDPTPTNAQAAVAAVRAHTSSGSAQTNVSTSPSRWSTPLIINPSSTLPPATVTALQRAFSPDSCYWQDHKYFDAATPFWSYTYDLNEPPSNIVELACQQLRARLLLAEGAHNAAGSEQHAGYSERNQAGSCLVSHQQQQQQEEQQQIQGLRDSLSRATHVEWWAHSRAPNAAHQLHFDCDETRLRKGREAYSLTHPSVGSVLFLTPHGGPTLILDQAPGAPHLASRGWVAHPEPAALLTFPGNLLHGVLPQAPKQATPETQTQQQVGGAVSDEGCGGMRTTLILAWWCREQSPQQETQPQGELCSSKDSLAAGGSTGQLGGGAERSDATEFQGLPTATAAGMDQKVGGVEGGASWVGWSSDALQPQMRPPPLKRRKAVYTVQGGEQEAGAAPQWVHLFSELATQASAAPEGGFGQGGVRSELQASASRALEDAGSEERAAASHPPPLTWRAAKQVAPAWVNVQQQREGAWRGIEGGSGGLEAGDAVFVPEAALSALPDLRLFVPHERYFSYLYPV